MKGNFRFKLLLLVALLATALFSSGDAFGCSSAFHFAQNITVDHVGMATMAGLVILPLSAYVKENCTISPTEIAELTLKYGKIKILTVVLEPPVYDAEGNITDKGEFYSYAVRRPDPGHIRLLMGYAEKGESDKYVEVAIKNLVIAGDLETLKTDGLVYMGIATQLKDMIKPYQSFLANA